MVVQCPTSNPSRLDEHQGYLFCSVDIGRSPTQTLILSDPKNTMNYKFKGVFIPANIWLDKTLSPNQKFLLCEIDALSNGEDDPCFAGNAHFSEHINVTKDTIKNMINKLEKLGYLKRKYEDNDINKKRFMWTNPLNDTPVSKNDTPVSKNDTPVLNNDTPVSKNDTINTPLNKQVNKQVKKEQSKELAEDKNEAIKSIITFFDHERKKIQPNFIRAEYKEDAQYQLRVHLHKTGRTPEMFYDAIRWLFSGEKEAAFFLGYVVNIGKLIEHYNSIEMKYITNSKETKIIQTTNRAIKYYMAQGMTLEEAIKKAKE